MAADTVAEVEDFSLEPEQIDEIKRRMAELDAGKVELVDGDEAIRRARARIAARR